MNRPLPPPAPGQAGPFLLQSTSVRQVMGEVLLALIPGIAAYAYLFGPAILIQVGWASLVALGAEALMISLRGRPLGPSLGDGSVLVTAWLIALAFPPLAPWWLTLTGVLFAVVVAKHLYGGLGQNPFNPAMVAYALCIVSFPALMAQWPALGGGWSEQAAAIWGGVRPDALTSATPLDFLRTTLRQENPQPVISILGNPQHYGLLAGRGYEVVNLALLAGGAWLLIRGRITWHIPVAFLAALALLTGGLWWLDPRSYANPLFHLFAGGSLLGAFFIATDPVSGATTPRGKLIFGAGAGLLAGTIRLFGAYPDGVAFAVLLMNLCVPLIDRFTQPPVFGMKQPVSPAGKEHP